MFGLSVAIAGALLPDLVRDFGLSGSSSGQLLSTFTLATLGGSLLFGPISDRYGYKFLMISCGLTVASGMFLLAWSVSYFHLLLSFILMGVGGGMLNGLTNVLVARTSTDRTRDGKLGVLGGFYSVGGILLPLVVSLAKPYFTYNEQLMALAGGLALLCLAFTLVSYPPPAKSEDLNTAAVKKLLGQPFLLFCAFLLALQAGSESLITYWVPLFLQQFQQWSEAASLLSLSIYMAFFTASRFLLPQLLKFTTSRKVVFWGIVFGSVGFAVAAFAPQQWLVYTGLAIGGYGFGPAFPYILSIVGQRYPAMAGTAFSVVLVAALGGSSILNLASGELIEASGISSFSYLLLATLLLLLLLHVNRYRQNTAVTKERS